MPDNSTDNRPLVFHVTGRTTDSGRETQRKLQATGAQVESCEDVYRGLARIMRSLAARPAAVVVCVDGIGSAELDFFRLISRFDSSLPVYVYGGSRSESRAVRAIEFGATGRLTDTILESFEPAPTSPLLPDSGRVPSDTSRAREDAEPTESAEEVERVCDDPKGEPAVEEIRPVPLPPEQAATPVSPVDGDQSDDRDVPSAPVRVPWLRYDDHPVRRPPSTREAKSRAPASDAEDRPSADGDSYEPLLTHAELEALIGDDDIASITPPDPRRAREDEEP